MRWSNNTKTDYENDNDDDDDEKTQRIRFFAVYFFLLACSIPIERLFIDKSLNSLTLDFWFVFTPLARLAADKTTLYNL